MLNDKIREKINLKKITKKKGYGCQTKVLATRVVALQKGHHDNSNASAKSSIRSLNSLANNA
jgi:hypothetical protein